MAVGAVVGGLVWARFGAAEPSSRTLAALLICLTLAQAAAAGVSANLVLVGAVLAVGALAASPTYVIAFSAADDLVEPEQRTEASTWVTVGANAGLAVGTAAAGLAAGIGGSAPFLLAATLTAGAEARQGFERQFSAPTSTIRSWVRACSTSSFSTSGRPAALRIDSAVDDHRGDDQVRDHAQVLGRPRVGAGQAGQVGGELALEQLDLVPDLLADGRAARRRARGR